MVSNPDTCPIGADIEADGVIDLATPRPPGAHEAIPLQDLCAELHTHFHVQCKPGNLITYTMSLPLTCLHS
jgi:hypothetical protein